MNKNQGFPSFWWVCQDDNFEKEISGKYLKAPGNLKVFQ